MGVVSPLMDRVCRAARLRQGEMAGPGALFVASRQAVVSGGLAGQWAMNDGLPDMLGRFLRSWIVRCEVCHVYLDPKKIRPGEACPVCGEPTPRDDP